MLYVFLFTAISGACYWVINKLYHWFSSKFPSIEWNLCKSVCQKGFSKWFCQKIFGNKDSCQPFCYRVVVNLVIGLGIMMLIIPVKNLPLVIETEDASIDFAMILNKNVIPPRDERENIPFVFLDVDDKTYHSQSWGEPLFTPRNYLKNIIETSIAANPRLVLVDIDVSQPTLPPNDPIRKNYLANQLHPHDQALKDYLNNYATECKRKDEAKEKADGPCPIIILVRALSSDGSNSLPQPRIGFLEEVVRDGKPYLQWASANFLSSEDQVIRRWELWKPVCRKDGKPMVVPSIELVAMANIQKDCSIEMMWNALKPFQPDNCNIVHEQKLPDNFKLCQLDTETNIHSINQRINYQMSWPFLLPANDGLEDDSEKIDTLTTETQDVLTIFSAEHFAESSSSVTQASLNKLKGSIVVIGGSYEGNDVHLTPLEQMPGALIIINALHTLLTLDKGVIKELKLSYQLLIMTFFIIIITLILVKFDSTLGIILSLGISSLFIALAMWGLSFEGTWMNFTVPVLIVQIYHIINDFEGLRKKIGESEELRKKIFECDKLRKKICENAELRKRIFKCESEELHLSEFSGKKVKLGNLK